MNLQFDLEQKEILSQNIVGIQNQFISVRGSVIDCNASEFQKNIKELITVNSKSVTIDFRNVKNTDLKGINALIKVQKWLGENGKTVVIQMSKKNPLEEMMHLTKFNPFLKIELV